MVCTSCYAIGEPKTVIPGGAGITVLQVLLLAGAIFGRLPMLIVVAIVLAVIAGAMRRRVCRTCGAQTLVPSDSPRGREVLASRPPPGLPPG